MQRLTATEALNHPWFQQQRSQPPPSQRSNVVPLDTKKNASRRHSSSSPSLRPAVNVRPFDLCHFFRHSSGCHYFESCLAHVHSAHLLMHRIFTGGTADSGQCGQELPCVAAELCLLGGRLVGDTRGLLLQWRPRTPAYGVRVPNIDINHFCQGSIISSADFRTGWSLASCFWGSSGGKEHPASQILSTCFV